MCIGQHLVGFRVIRDQKSKLQDLTTLQYEGNCHNFPLSQPTLMIQRPRIMIFHGKTILGGLEVNWMTFDGCYKHIFREWCEVV